MWKDLTPRQMEIYSLIQWGATQKMVANALGISALTVNKTITNIYERTGLDAVRLRKSYMIEFLGVDKSKCPLGNYDFAPRITFRIKSVAFCFLMIVCFQLFQNSVEMQRVVRSRSARTARSSRSGRRKQIGEFELIN